MKRRIALIILFLLIFSTIGSAYSAISSLNAKQSKIFKFGATEVNVTALEIKGKTAKFIVDGIESPFIDQQHNFEFKKGFFISIADFFELQGAEQPARVKILVEPPTISCGSTRCFGWEKCVDKKKCEPFCGNDYCEKGEESTCIQDCRWCGDGRCANTENCGNCASDCGCNKGNICKIDACTKVMECDSDDDCNDKDSCTEDSCKNEKCAYDKIQQGCELNGECKAVDTIFCTSYCSASGKWLPLKGKSAECQKDFECQSRTCNYGKCTKAGIFRRLLDWYNLKFSKVKV